VHDITQRSQKASTERTKKGVGGVEQPLPLARDGMERKKQAGGSVKRNGGLGNTEQTAKILGVGIGFNKGDNYQSLVEKREAREGGS